MNAASKFACDWQRGIAAAKLAHIQKAGPTVVSETQRDFNADGTPYKAQSSATIAASASVPICETSIKHLAPGEIEHLANHGVSIGIEKGLVSLIRSYVPTAERLIAQVRGAQR